MSVLNIRILGSKKGSWLQKTLEAYSSNCLCFILSHFSSRLSVDQLPQHRGNMAANNSSFPISKEALILCLGSSKEVKLVTLTKSWLLEISHDDGEWKALSRAMQHWYMVPLGEEQVPAWGDLGRHSHICP